MVTDAELTMLKRLRRLAKDGPQFDWTGICGNVRSASAEEIRILYPMFRKWPEFSGTVGYPVPAPKGISPESYYWSSVDLWEGEYGSARKRLLAFLIKSLESKTREGQK